MKVNLFLAVIKRGGMTATYVKGEKLATAELEVVPGGTYTIDGVKYVLTGKPEFHLNKKAQVRPAFPGPGPISMNFTTHQLDEVDLLVEKFEPSHGV